MLYDSVRKQGDSLLVFFVSRKKCFEKGVIVVIRVLHSFHAHMIEQAGKIASEQ